MSATTPPTPDGDGWPTGYPSSNGATSVEQARRAERLVVLAYITALAMPPVGFVLGIAVAVRPAKAGSKHGILIIALSLIAAVVWILVFTSGALRSTSNELN